MKREIKVGKWLDCGCCGQYFTTWKGYQDQDQDTGFGICQSCQEDAELRSWFQFAEMRDALGEALTRPLAIFKWNNMDPDQQAGAVMGAIDKGHFTWTIGPA